MTGSPTLLPRFRRALGWIIQGLLGVLFAVLVWFLEDRYALISGTDVRIKVTRLAEETRADGKTILVCTFDKYTLRRGVTERLWVSDQPQPIHSISGLAREWSDLPVADVYEHLMRPWNSGYAIEIPIKGPLTSRFTLRPGNVIRLKRGDRVVFATYQLPPSCDPTDIAVQEFELSFEIE